jgi:Family of unknown function (DUF5675)
MNQKILDFITKTLISFFSKNEKEVEVKVEIPISTPVEPVKADIPSPAPIVPGVRKFILTHNRFCADGIFGELKTEDGQFVCYTLEHSYDNKPKVVDGTYTCKRGPHRLHNMTQDFITFEVMGVPPFNGVSVSGILFHWGNYNKDSEGCILMGSSETPTMIGNSRAEWATFMQSLEGVDTFELTVVSSSA